MVAMAYDLSRFIEAQQRDYAIALAEIRAARKQSHWMWYIFPQLKGLGRSSTSEYYGIDGLGEATAFLKDTYLGHNLREISSELLGISDKDAHQVFGSPDDLKLRSSMTLFAHAGPEDTVFRDVIEAYFDGREDQRTLRLLDL